MKEYFFVCERKRVTRIILISRNIEMNSCVIRTLILHGNSVPRKDRYRTQKVEAEHEKSFYGFMSFQG